MIDDAPEEPTKAQKGPEESTEPATARELDSSSILDLENIQLAETSREDSKKSENIFEKFDKLDDFDTLD